MAFAVVLQACGDDAAPRGPEPKVRLQVTVPQDGATVRAETVAVEGTVAPAGARVQVLGKDVGVESGRWHAEVPLEPGANLAAVGDVTVVADASLWQNFISARNDVGVFLPPRLHRLPPAALVGIANHWSLGLGPQRRRDSRPNETREESRADFHSCEVAHFTLAR